MVDQKFNTQTGEMIQGIWDPTPIIHQIRPALLSGNSMVLKFDWDKKKLGYTGATWMS